VLLLGLVGNGWCIDFRQEEFKILPNILDKLS